jgi:hypothetical protein
MNNNQQKVISLYKEMYPQDTIKTISLKTSIQQTRVFRIFNGAEMKISEFEKLERLVINKNLEKSFILIARKCLDSLPQNQINQMQSLMSQNLKLASFRINEIQASYELTQAAQGV